MNNPRIIVALDFAAEESRPKKLIEAGDWAGIEALAHEASNLKR
jgi:hypothetical protein